jgi:hypothetical protein
VGDSELDAEEFEAAHLAWIESIASQGSDGTWTWEYGSFAIERQSDQVDLVIASNPLDGSAVFGQIVTG